MRSFSCLPLGLALLVTGCVARANGTSPSPLSSSFPDPVAIQAPDRLGSESILNLPQGSLTSEAALLKTSADELCFDIKIRTWQGAVRRWVATVEVDGHELPSRQIELEACTPGSVEPDELSPSLSCLAIDTALSSRPTDALDNIKVRGSRVCARHEGLLRTDSKEVRLDLDQGAASYSFRWALAGSAGRAEL